MMQVALALSVTACGARVDIGSAAGGGTTTGSGGAGGATGSQGGGGASPCDLPIGTPCDCNNFPSCPVESIKGMPCCEIKIMCGATGECIVGWAGAVCDDSCAIGCQYATDMDQCAAIGCTVTPNGCVPTKDP